MSIRVGDMVRVVNPGARYTTYSGYFHHYGLNDYVSRYTGDGMISGKVGEVLFKGKHPAFKDPMLYVVELVGNKDIILLGEYGVELIPGFDLPDLKTVQSEFPLSDLLGI